MAPPISRGVALNIAAFLGLVVFCVTTQAPMIQQDILRRCRDALLMHQIPIEGLSANGRDVLLTGSAESIIVSARARTILANVDGVRAVYVKIADVAQAQPASDLEPAETAQQREVQAKIDRLLQNKEIAFKTEGAVLLPESETVLDSIAASLAEVPGLPCEIRGYDNHPRDSRQPSRQTARLALERALSTEDYLISKGIAEWRLSTHAFQSGEPDARHPDRVIDFVVRAR